VVCPVVSVATAGWRDAISAQYARLCSTIESFAEGTRQSIALTNRRPVISWLARSSNSSRHAAPDLHVLYI